MANAQFGAPIPLLGIEGPRGLQGAPGFSVLAGNGVPEPDLGSVGDIFVSLDEGLLYAPKTASGWPSATRSLIGPQGALGAVGPSGAGLLNGYGPPADTLGTDGDSYFNSQNGAIYGPKDKGHWPTSFTSLIGPSGSQGDVGTLILAASGGPNDAQGSDGDFFVDTLDGRFYGPKDKGSWGNGFSLIGPMGSTGDRGERGLAGSDGATILQGAGAPSSQGKPGDFYFDSDSSVFYGPRGSAVNNPWPPQGFSVRGAEGPIGPQGPGGMMGADGKTLRSGAGDPSDSLGEDGDFYFDALSGYLVGPKDNGKWPLPGFLLKGPSGDRGERGPSGEIGPQGPGILSGGGAPAASLGTDGSFYIDGQNFVVYGPKDSSAQNPWYQSRNIVGPRGPAGQDSQVPGPQGIAGARGFSVQSGQGAPPSSLGNDGDLYVDLTGPNLYGAKTSGAWPTTFEPLNGPRGPAGADSTVPGPSGPMGYSLLTGSGAPSSSYGNDGDAYLDLDAGALYGAKANGVWPSKFKSLIGASGQTGAQGAPGAAGSNGTILRYGNGAPTAQTAANDGDFYIDQTASRLYGPRANGAFPSSFVSLVGPTGANGALIITGNGPPSNSIGTLGDVYLDLAAGNLYGNKTQSGWPTTFKSLVGPAGSNATVPNDITGNSLTLAPVSGSANPVKLQMSSGNGQVFLVDANGNVSAAASLTAAGPSSLGAVSASTVTASGSLSVGASASIAGAVTAARFAATSPGNASAPIWGYSKDFTGNGVTTTGVYSESNFGQLYEAVESFTARSITYVGTNPRDNGAGFLTHNAISNVSGAGNVAHRWYVQTSALAMSIAGNGAVAMGASLTVAGGLSVGAGINLQSGVLTFPDGSTLSTATVANQPSYRATSPGTAAAPAHAYTGAANGAGLYFDGNGNSLISVNGFKSLYSTAASGAAAGANGWAIASTQGSGSALLALFGGGNTTTPVASIDGAGAITGASITSPTATHSGAVTAGSLSSTGTVTAANVTLGASGKLTFGDGTSMTTAATGSGGGGTAGSQMRYGTGAPSTTNPSVQNDGDSYIDQQQSMLYGPRANGVWPTTPISLIGPTGPQGPQNPNGRDFIPLGGFQRKSGQTGCFRTQMVTAVGGSGTSFGFIPINVPMPFPGYIVGVSVAFPYVNGTNVAASLQVFKNSLNGTTSPFIDVPALAAGQVVSAPITFSANQYPFAAGDYLGMGVTQASSDNASTVGLFVVYTA